MKRILFALLLVVVLALAITQATAENIDLSTMTTSELETLSKKIDNELAKRSLEKSDTGAAKQRRETAEKYGNWLNKFDMESIMVDIASGKSGLNKACADEIGDMAVDAWELLLEAHVNHDITTDTYQVTPQNMFEFDGDYHILPYIDDGWMRLVVGFPYKNSFLYDQITLVYDIDTESFDRFSKSKGFSIEFETLSGEHWEYSVIDPSSGSNNIESVVFTKEGSVRKETYVFTQEEKQAFALIYDLSSLYDDMRFRLQNWATTGE